MSTTHISEEIAKHYTQLDGSKNYSMQCCVALLMGMNLNDVPDFTSFENTSSGWEAFYTFFESRNLRANLFTEPTIPAGIYLAGGKTERGTDHMVLMRDGELFFDPHPSRSGLLKVEYIFLVSIEATLPKL